MQRYLEKSKIEDFSVDPEIQLEQIAKAERLSKKIAKYLTNETIESEDLNTDKLTYVEIWRTQ